MKNLILLFVFLWVSFGVGAKERAVSIAGSWRFELDRRDAGIQERWFERSLPQTVQLPGALQNQGYGDDITLDTPWTGASNIETWLRGRQYEKHRQPGQIKVPFSLQPEKHYVGAAWYQREVQIPASWQGKRVVLTFERTHWETRVWLDGKEAGVGTSLSTPNEFDLGTGLAPGRHTLTLRVDNRMLVDVGSWAHSVSDHTQGNWNGIVGRIELAATSPVWIEDAQVYPDVASKSAKVSVRIGNATGTPGNGTLTVGNRTTSVTWDEKGGKAEIEVRLSEKAQLWGEFSPKLHQLALRLQGPNAEDERKVTFGLRELRVEDKQFVLNGRKTFFRGTLECCIFPKTGYPPTDVASWKRIIRICQEHGLNHIRFHSFCPPEAAFVAADELGFYYSVEVAAWATVGDGKPIDAWLYEEAARILKAYGNHPSFLMMPYGNEPSGSNHAKWLGEWVNHWKRTDSRRLYTSAAGWPQIPENQFHITPAPRGPGGWLGKDYRSAIANLNQPVIVHEMGQWCVYPNFDEIKKYTGPLKPKNFEIFRDSLAEHGMLDQWRDFFHASGKLQALCYKEEIEAAFRTPGVCGVQLLDLHDFPGQGTALVGVLDPFWDSKGYISAKEYRRFFDSTVPLARLLKRVWTTDETLSAEVELAHFGPAPFEEAVAVWKLITKDGKMVAKGELPPKRVEQGSGISLGRVSASLAQVVAPKACKLVIGLKGTRFENDWDVWVYPPRAEAEPSADVLIVSSLDEAATARLESGGKVLLNPLRLSRENPKLGFEPIFWNRYMFNTQGRQTLGLLCNPKHPALALFPTENYQNWQWNDLVSKAQAMTLDALPRELRPIVQVIDDWNSNRKLGLVWEGRVGRGKLLVCTADLQRDLAKRPAAGQLRASLLRYMAGKEFQPQIEINREDLCRLLELNQPSQLVKLGASVIEVDSEDAGNGNTAAQAIDGDSDTIWHTQWQPSNAPMPHHLVIDLGRSVTLKGISHLPRQEMANGRIAGYEIYCGNDPKAWGPAITKGTWPNTHEPQRVEFTTPVNSRYLKLVATSEVNGNPFASIAELDVITDEP